MGFIDFIISPLYSSFNEFQTFNEGLENLQNNRDYWDKRALEEAKPITFRSAARAARASVRLGNGLLPVNEDPVEEDEF